MVSEWSFVLEFFLFPSKLLSPPVPLNLHPHIPYPTLWVFIEGILFLLIYLVIVGRGTLKAPSD